MLRLACEGQHVDIGRLLAKALDQRLEIVGRGCRREIAPQQRHVEGDVLAAHEAGDAHTVLLADCQWQQHERLPVRVAGNDDAGLQALARADVNLPLSEEIEPLIRRQHLGFEAAPNRLGGVHVVKNIDMRNAGRFRPRPCFCRRTFHHSSHEHRKA